MSDGMTDTVHKPAKKDQEIKRTRKVSEKPFVAMKREMLLTTEGKEVEAWIPVGLAKTAKTTADVIKCIQEDDSLGEGTYLIVQFCAEKAKKVEQVIKAEMV